MKTALKSGLIRAAYAWSIGVGAMASAERGTPADEITFFAIGNCAANSRNYDRWVPQMAALGIRDLRSNGGYWGGVEKPEGTFTFETLDQRYDYLMSQGVRSGILLYGTPEWNKLDKPGTLPVHAIDKWANFVEKITAHYKGRVKHFEVWNEPPNGTKGAPPADYAKIVAASYAAVKKANPDALVGLSAKSVHVNYLDRVIEAGAKGKYDYITLHPYEVLGTVTQHPGTEQIYMRIVPTVRKMLAARDPAKVDVPIIVTEIGFDTKHGNDKQLRALVMAYTMGAAQGIQSMQWFEGMDGDSGPLGLIDGKQRPRPAYKALGELIRLIGQKPNYLGWVQLNDKHFGFVFQGTQGTVMSMWGGTKASDEIDFGQNVKIIDPGTGNVREATRYTITPAPILIDGVPAAIVQQAQANKDKPFPWGGDYTNAKSVSITFGEKNIEKGLHTLSAETVAADVLAYGGNARSGTVPGGNIFNVDANFLNYSATPIEITAVVRRNEKNEPAKLECEYEAIGFYDKYKKLPAFDIPDNQNWHTAKWRIDDAQFVATWAFNFRFNSGKYVIQSVTVTRLDR